MVELNILLSIFLFKDLIFKTKLFKIDNKEIKANNKNCPIKANFEF
jgi:hypothetical protein